MPSSSSPPLLGSPPPCLLRRRPEPRETAAGAGLRGRVVGLPPPRYRALRRRPRPPPRPGRSPPRQALLRPQGDLRSRGGFRPDRRRRRGRPRLRPPRRGPRPCRLHVG
ncbi:hypothetical protein BHE74_00008527 [Ensete ventricosum]|nr:hypothetical protein GW17_00002563 [Ensete ventricosum]RWW82985.1 hypothetical protein BHE74_00008527 [Ensete ventricosum]